MLWMENGATKPLAGAAQEAYRCLTRQNRAIRQQRSGFLHEGNKGKKAWETVV